MWRWIVILAMLYVAIGCSNAADSIVISGELPAPNISIGELRKGVPRAGVERVEEDIIVVGRVTTSDDDSNFSRSLVVEDDSGAVEVMVGLYSLSGSYPMGTRVALRLRDCALGYRYGVLQAGAMTDSYDMYAVDYLASREAVDRVIVRGVDVEPIVPRRVTIGELVDDMCGRIVSIDGLVLVESVSSTFCDEPLDDARWGGYALFKDESGDSIAVYTREYANYATSHIPQEAVSLTGIVQWGNYAGGECFQLKMRYEEDCAIR